MYCCFPAKENPRHDMRNPYVNFNVPVYVNKAVYYYFMTADYNSMVMKLHRIGCRTPSLSEWKENPCLHEDVRENMMYLGMRYSLTVSNGACALNCYEPPSVPLIIFLHDIPLEPEMLAVRIRRAGKESISFMTNDFSFISERKKMMGFLEDIQLRSWRLYPDLDKNIRTLMKERGKRYLLSGDSIIDCNPAAASVPLIVYFSDLPNVLLNRLNHRMSMYSHIYLHIQASANRKRKERLNLANNPLMNACAKGSVKDVKLLLKHKADVNFQDEFGQTALMIAAMKDHDTIVQLLIQHGADVTLKANNGFDAYLFAVYLNSMKSIDVFRNCMIKTPGLCLSVDMKKEPFIKKLDYYIQKYISLKKNGNLSFIYRKSRMSKQTFSKVRSSSDPEFRPKKETVFQLAIGMELTLAQTEDLLNSAGYYFLPDSEFDSIVRNFISRQVFDICAIEDALYKRTGRTLSFYDEHEASKKRN